MLGVTRLWIPSWADRFLLGIAEADVTFLAVQAAVHAVLRQPVEVREDTANMLASTAILGGEAELIRAARLL